ncbi:phosphotyrosine protein phosphatase I superfamily [Thamnocephalis sphaerospora]|uniref:Phosphotyrosine protein phosphatase I superfamily n=1 Tax=Thamnocephalis sphaerospora TaxID=78915 RepID=A0A4P9XMV9_9FUNG|nr:phosphotyrosine protein phosphatase I superfamily [Thamnocephalis sphaerospora]|eukprot:RKP07277.1 phosphotyrosine protein phosphatase I superfamily [Thamnocephalis sphaerospora]
MTRTIGIIFVCHGNFCRSPMAEAVFAHIVQECGLAGQFRIDSAGISSRHVGEQPDERSVACCKRHGVAVECRARLVTADDFNNFDYVLCMDKQKLSNLENIQPKNARATLKLLGEYDPEGPCIIEDPYNGGEDGFETNFQQVTRCSHAFLESLSF